MLQIYVPSEGASDLYLKQENKIQDVRAKNLYPDRTLITWTGVVDSTRPTWGTSPAEVLKAGVNKTHKVYKGFDSW